MTTGWQRVRVLEYQRWYSGEIAWLQDTEASPALTAKLNKEVRIMECSGCYWKHPDTCRICRAEEAERKLEEMRNEEARLNGEYSLWQDITTEIRSW